MYGRLKIETGVWGFICPMCGPPSPVPRLFPSVKVVISNPST